MAVGTHCWSPAGQRKDFFPRSRGQSTDHFLRALGRNEVAFITIANWKAGGQMEHPSGIIDTLARHADSSRYRNLFTSCALVFVRVLSENLFQLELGDLIRKHDEKSLLLGVARRLIVRVVHSYRELA
jgi:hypothetical protein